LGIEAHVELRSCVPSRARQGPGGQPRLLVSVGLRVEQLPSCAEGEQETKDATSRDASLVLHMDGNHHVILIAGGLTVAVLAELAHVLGADSQDVLCSGQSSAPALVAEGSAKIVLVLLVAKALGYALSLGSGFCGGPVFPAVFLGVALATLAVNLFDVSPTLAVAVGTAPGLAPATQLLFAALLVEISGLDASPTAVFATAAAWLPRTALDRRLAA
jgi:H+/Cl- antiporter ClcA